MVLISEFESNQVVEMEINHFSHEHPLLLVSDEISAVEEDQVKETTNCSGCDQSLDDDGSRYYGYGCKDCKFYLHKRCAELATEIQHPFHPDHSLTLLQKSPYVSGECLCDFCYKDIPGFLYSCDHCDFDLHINCALLQTSIAPNFHYSLHQHPLFIVQNHNDQLIDCGCSACEKQLSGPIYYCSVCSSNRTFFELHKECGELALEINHPFHPQHLLTLIFPQPPFDNSCQRVCNFCAGILSGFVYHCDVCQYDLHITCASLQSSIAPNFPTSLHQHPLLFLPNHKDHNHQHCSGCMEPLSGPIYHCYVCSYDSGSFNLHKECGELPLEINHPFHSQHPLTLSQKSTYDDGNYWRRCEFCRRSSSGFVYRCDVCQYDLHSNCALLQSSIAPNFPNSLHQHPLLFLPNHNNQVKEDCSGCMKPLSGPIYHCSVCSYYPYFNLHKECVELALEINHPYDPKHPLTLLPNPPSHPDKCSCYLCKIRWKGFVYSCSHCNFYLTPDDVSAPQTITSASHQHPWTLLSRQMTFTCDFCGTLGDRTPYICGTCNLLVHRNCISLPRKIMITRHHHVISHSYSLRQHQLEERLCRICYQEVNTRYGSYHCSHSDCNYIAHPLCATDESIWDGKAITDDYDDSSTQALLQSSNMITVVSEQMSDGERMVAIEIRHEFHDHNLRLISSGEIIDDESQCDGCMRPMSTPFYTCDQCNFGLHKDCAELARGKRHPFHKHLLMLSKLMYNSERCSACERPHNGFSYKCNEDCGAQFDIRCTLLSDTLEHPSHEHSLFLVHNFQANCSGGCHPDNKFWDMAYRCMKRCDFSLDMKCVTKPLTAWYKYDIHLLALTYSDDSSPSQHYCDLCEEKRDPKDWFYHCTDCDNSLHFNCALADPQFFKLGSKVPDNFHRHWLTVVKNIWNCPPCKVCSKLCNGVALECKESECKFTAHWKCQFFLG